MNSQKSLKIKFSIIAALALSFLLALGSFFGITLARADRSVTISGTSTFITSNKAEVWAHKVGEEDDENKTPIDYTMFVFNENKDSVNFRKNLAFNWIENSAYKQEEPKDENKTEGEEGNKEEEKNPEIKFDDAEGWFNLEIGFDYGEGVEFEKFVITFESQQYTQTKDGKSTNYIVFVPAESNKLSVYIAHKEKDDKDVDAVLTRLETATANGTVEVSEHIKIGFNNYESGNYSVVINDTITGTFENVGKTYSKYSSSTTTPVTPLSFEAVFGEEKEDGDVEAHGKAFMTLYNLNGQSFKLKNARESTDADKHRVGGTVNDTTPPVLCLDKAVPFIKYNGEITFDYTVIDVLASSPSLTTSYYMLTKDDVTDGNSPVYKEKDGDYKKVTDSDNQYIFPHSKHYIPNKETDLKDTALVSEDYEVNGAIKVVLKLTDTTSTGGQTTYVLLDWFVEKDYLFAINGTNYIAVTDDKQGLSYVYTQNGESNPDITGDNVNTDWKDIVDAYQAKVDAAAKDLKAGSKNYFYLPSAESLFNTDATPYQDLTFSIYYNHGSQQQSTGKNANELSINLTKAGKYKFTIYAKDAAGNDMYYYDATTGEKTDLETSNIWNMYNQKKDTEYEGMKKYLPWFEFTVEESEITIEDPDEQATAYVGSSFTPDSFEINGVSVKTDYTLYEFNNEEWAKNNGGAAMTYKDFSEQVATLLKDSRQYFTKIRPTGDLKEGTNDYDRFHDYGWNGSSLTFTPQTANSFYVITCEARSSEIATPETGYMTIAAATKVAPLKGEDTWVQDNITSIILLCIAGASLIGIILLLVIKPKNKGDIDEVIESPRKKSK